MGLQFQLCQNSLTIDKALRQWNYHQCKRFGNVIDHGLVLDPYLLCKNFIYLRSFIRHEERCFVTFSNTSKAFKGCTSFLDSWKCQQMWHTLMIILWVKEIGSCKLYDTPTPSEPYRPIRNMATTNQHKFIFVKQTNEPIHEKEHLDRSQTYSKYGRH